MSTLNKQTILRQGKNHYPILIYFHSKSSLKSTSGFASSIISQKQLHCECHTQQLTTTRMGTYLKSQTCWGNLDHCDLE